ncbi:uncharacterized protein LOC144167965 [Haemaphysalis longicornis]
MTQPSRSVKRNEGALRAVSLFATDTLQSVFCHHKTLSPPRRQSQRSDCGVGTGGAPTHEGFGYPGDVSTVIALWRSGFVARWDDYGRRLAHDSPLAASVVNGFSRQLSPNPFHSVTSRYQGIDTVTSPELPRLDYKYRSHPDAPFSGLGCTETGRMLINSFFVIQRETQRSVAQDTSSRNVMQYNGPDAHS